MGTPGLTEALHAASAELAALARVADEAGAATLAATERLQALDRVSQHLAELAVFLLGVAELVPDPGVDLGPVLAGLRVGAVSRRLRGEVVEADDAGLVELFGT